MRTACIVHDTPEDRQKNTEWIKDDYPAWKNGQHVYQIHCAGCHNINGNAGTGPALNLTWNRQGKTAGGESFTADENYVRKSILYPSEVIAAGFGKKGSISQMNSFQGILDDAPGGDIDHVIAYLKYLQDPNSVSNTKLKDLSDDEKSTEETPAEAAE